VSALPSQDQSGPFPTWDGPSTLPIDGGQLAPLVAALTSGNLVARSTLDD
jgi:hypothetical protein